MKLRGSLITLIVILSFCSAGTSFAQSNRNFGSHIEIVGNTSIFHLNGDDDDYIGGLIMPEIRYRYGIDDRNSFFAGIGYSQISQFTDDADDQTTVERKSETQWTTSVGWAFDIQNEEDAFKFGFNNFVLGVGFGNFETDQDTNKFEDGFFVFLGFTITAMDIWISN